MWQYRELIWSLTITDLKNKYQNTTLGFFWSILSPLLLALVLYIVFRNLFGQEENFAINLIVGIIAWRFFAVGSVTSLSSVVNKTSLVTKVYIPRQILVLSNGLANLISSWLEFVILVPIIFVLKGHVPVTTPLFIVIHLLYFWFLFGVGLFLSAFYVYFRDLNQIWDVLVNILFFMCPIIYPVSIMSAGLQRYYLLNPLTRLIIMYRKVMILGELPSLGDVLVVVVIGTLLVLIGSFIFAKLQRRFAEVL